MMSSLCFETEGSSSGRRLYIQVWYSMLYIHQYKQTARTISFLAPYFVRLCLAPSDKLREAHLFSCALYPCRLLLPFLIHIQLVSSNCGFYMHRSSPFIIPFATDIIM